MHDAAEPPYPPRPPHPPAPQSIVPGGDAPAVPESSLPESSLPESPWPAGAPDGPSAAPPASVDVAPRRRRRRARGWVIGSGVALLLVVAGAAIHFWALDSYAQAAATFQSARADADEARGALSETTQDFALTAIAADRVNAAATGDGLADPSAQSAFAQALTDFHADVLAAQAVLDEPTPSVTSRPVWTWELVATSGELADATERAEAAATEADAAQATLDTADSALHEAALPLFASVAPAAAALEAANVSARTIVVLDFRDAADAVAGTTVIGSGAAVAFEELAHSADILRQSNEQELAEKSGALYATRLEIEAYARSISGGVVLDFDWGDVVAGVGGDEGMGGTATWATPRGGFSTITLSNSVAENWPSADARALVTHEVGHAITSKCSDKFDSANQQANEEWATAWAISMGQTAEGNGVQAYGYPSQQMIDVAATCR